MASLITLLSPEFAAALPDGGKLAGLDVGTRTIGLAICDAGWHFAGPAETVRRTKFTQDLGALRDFVAREHVVGLVVGLPLNMDGTDSPRTQSVRASPTISRRSSFRSCCGTSAGPPRRLSER